MKEIIVVILFSADWTTATQWFPVCTVHSGITTREESRMLQLKLSWAQCRLNMLVQHWWTCTVCQYSTTSNSNLFVCYTLHTGLSPSHISDAVTQSVRIRLVIDCILPTPPTCYTNEDQVWERASTSLDWTLSLELTLPKFLRSAKCTTHSFYTPF